MVRHKDATHYEAISWADVFAMIAEELSRLDSPDQASFYTSGETTNEPEFLLQLFAGQAGDEQPSRLLEYVPWVSRGGDSGDTRRGKGRCNAGGHGELGADLYLWEREVGGCQGRSHLLAEALA